MLSISQRARNFTPSRSTRVISCRSNARRWPAASSPSNRYSSATSSVSIRPLKLNTTSFHLTAEFSAWLLLHVTAKCKALAVCKLLNIKTYARDGFVNSRSFRETWGRFAKTLTGLNLLEAEFVDFQWPNFRFQSGQWVRSLTTKTYMRES